MPSPTRRHSPDQRRSRSPPRRDRRRSRSPRRRSPPPRHSRRSPSPRRNDRRRPPSSLSQGRKFEWGREEDRQKLEQQKREPLNEEDIQKPNFGLSGALAAETNTTAQGVELKYNEPPEAAKPPQKWRLYVFKGDKQIGKAATYCRKARADIFGRGPACTSSELVSDRTRPLSR